MNRVNYSIFSDTLILVSKINFIKHVIDNVPFKSGI